MAFWFVSESSGVNFRGRVLDLTSSRWWSKPSWSGRPLRRPEIGSVTPSPSANQLMDSGPRSDRSSSVPSSSKLASRTSGVTSNRAASPWSDAVRTRRSLAKNAAHPIQIALRTYALSLSLSLGPSLIQYVLPLFSAQPLRDFTKNRKGPRLVDVLKRELGFNGLAFALMVAAGGGAALQDIWDLLEEHEQWLPEASPNPDSIANVNPWCKFVAWATSCKPTVSQKSFISNLISSSLAAILLRVGRRSSRERRSVLPMPGTSPISEASHRMSLTLDLTLLLLVRAFDAAVQSFVFNKSENAIQTTTRSKKGKKPAEGSILKETLEREKRKQESSRRRRYMTTLIDAVVFWGCSARSVCCLPDS
jgi:hypothetical protein